MVHISTKLGVSLPSSPFLSHSLFHSSGPGVLAAGVPKRPKPCKIPYVYIMSSKVTSQRSVLSHLQLTPPCRGVTCSIAHCSLLSGHAPPRRAVGRLTSPVCGVMFAQLQSSLLSPGGCMVSPSSEQALNTAAALLGVDPDELNQALLSRVMQTSKGGAKGTVIM